MSLKYLNSTGLSNLVTNIKNWVTARIPTKTSEITNDSGFITGTSDCVHTTGNETIAGEKTFTTFPIVKPTHANNGIIKIKSPTTFGTAPSTTTYTYALRCIDNEDTILADFLAQQSTNGANSIQLRVRNTDGTLVYDRRVSLSVRGTDGYTNFSPNADNLFYLGTANYKWKSVYANSYYLGTTAFGDIVTHNASEYSLVSHTHTKSEITDFPTIPTVNNATLTIQKNGTTVKTFTANASSNVTANITVPTKVSELTNDNRYIPFLTPPSLMGFDWSTQYPGKVGIKIDATWLGGILTTANTTIPTKTSDLTNDSGFLTSHQSLSNYVTLNSNQTLASTKSFTTNINTASPATSSRETWRINFTKNDTNGSGAVQIGTIQFANTGNFCTLMRLANPRSANKPTSGDGVNTGNCWSGIGVLYDFSLNRGYPYVYGCSRWADSSNSDDNLASTSWVRRYCETTKGFLTSSSLSTNFVTTDTAQTVTGSKTFSSLTKTTGKSEYNSPADINDAIYNIESTYWGPNSTNKPSSSYGVLLSLNREGNVHTSTSNGWLSQIAIGTDNRLYTRVKPNTTQEWTAWKEYLTSHQSLSNYVTLDGAQTISGGKTFSKSFGDGDPSVLIQSNTAYANGTWNYPLAALAPNMKAGANIFMPIGRNFAAGNCAGWHWNYAGDNSNDNYVSVEFYAVGSHFAVYRDGRVFLSASPAASDNSTRVATTAYVKSQGYLSGTVPIANGGTGATTRLGAVQNLTNEHVGTDTQYFLTITQNWGKAGYCSVADAKTVLGIGTTSKKLTSIGERETEGTWTLTCTTLAPIYFKIVASKTSSTAEFVCGLSSTSSCRFVTSGNGYNSTQIVYTVVRTGSSGEAMWGMGIPTSTSSSVEVFIRNSQFMKTFKITAYQ